ncbi:hypothetical protein Ancab_012621 [Ancistrocladus abbreviatus]
MFCIFHFCDSSVTSMAALVRPLRRALLLESRSLIQLLHYQRQPIFTISSLFPCVQCQNRNYINEMRKSAFEGNILRLLRNEIDYELDRSLPDQPAGEFNGFKVDQRPGEQWVRLEKQFGDKEEIKVEVTMFDGSIPVPKSGDDKSQTGEVQLHITLIVSIFKEEYDKVLEFVCSAWPNAVEIERTYIRARAQMPHQPYTGPEFKELDDELQDSLYEFLEVRGIDDSLSAFLHNYMKNKDKFEFISWLRTVKSFIEKKVE